MMSIYDLATLSLDKSDQDGSGPFFITVLSGDPSKNIFWKHHPGMNLPQSGVIVVILNWIYSEMFFYMAIHGLSCWSHLKLLSLNPLITHPALPEMFFISALGCYLWDIVMWLYGSYSHLNTSQFYVIN